MRIALTETFLTVDKQDRRRCKQRRNRTFPWPSRLVCRCPSYLVSTSPIQTTTMGKTQNLLRQLLMRFWDG